MYSKVGNIGKILELKSKQFCSLILFLQGHDTTSAAICWTLYLLGLHTDIQVRHQTFYVTDWTPEEHSPSEPFSELLCPPVHPMIQLQYSCSENYLTHVYAT
jgi:hypothetical protein